MQRTLDAARVGVISRSADPKIAWPADDTARPGS